MRLNPPKKIVFYISAILAVVGLVFNFINVSVLPDIAVYVVFVGYLLLFLGNTLRGF